MGEQREIWKIVEVIRENGEQWNTTLQKKNENNEDKAKREIKEELHRKLDEDSWNISIYNMARERDEDSKGAKAGQ